MQKRRFLKLLTTAGILGSFSFETDLSRSGTPEPGLDKKEPSISPPVKIAFIIFDQLTLLDLVGMYDPIARLRSMKYLPELEWDFCAFEPSVKDNHGFPVYPDKVKNDLSAYDAVIIPGGFGTRPLQHDQEFIGWIKTAKEVPQKISVCTGALLLGAAGYLVGKRATTNASEYGALGKYCREVVKEKVVEDGNIITAGAVSSSLDLGLYLCEKWAGREAREEIGKRMDYRCYSSS